MTPVHVINHQERNENSNENELSNCEEGKKKNLKTCENIIIIHEAYQMSLWCVKDNVLVVSAGLYSGAKQLLVNFVLIRVVVGSDTLWLATGGHLLPVTVGVAVSVGLLGRRA